MSFLFKGRVKAISFVVKELEFELIKSGDTHTHTHTHTEQLKQALTSQILGV